MDTYMITNTSSSMSSSQVLPITSTSNYFNYSSNQNYNNFNNSNNNNNLNSTTKTTTTKIGTSNKDFLISSSTLSLSSSSSSLTNSTNSSNQHQNFHELSENKNSINFNNNSNNQTTTNNLIINSTTKNYSINNNNNISVSSTNGSNNSISYEIFESLNNQNIINKNLSGNEASISDSNNIALNSSSSQSSSFSSSSSISSSSSSPLNNSHLDSNTNKNFQQPFSSPTTGNLNNIDYFIKSQQQNNQQANQILSKNLETPSTSNPNTNFPNKTSKTTLSIDNNLSSVSFSSQGMITTQSIHSIDKNHFNSVDYSMENNINNHYQQVDNVNMNGVQSNLNINSNWNPNYYSNDNNSHDYYYSNIAIDNSNTYMHESNLNKNQLFSVDKTTQNNTTTDNNNNQAQFNNYNGYPPLNSNYDFNNYTQTSSLTNHCDQTYYNNNPFSFQMNNIINNSNNNQIVYHNQLINEQKSQQQSVFTNPITANQSYIGYTPIDDNIKSGIVNTSKSNSKLTNDYSIPNFNDACLLSNTNYSNSNNVNYLEKNKFNNINDNSKLSNLSNSSLLSSSPISGQNINKSNTSFNPKNNFNDIKVENTNTNYSNFVSDDYSNYYQTKQINSANNSNNLNTNNKKTVDSEKLNNNNNSDSYLSNDIYKNNKNKFKKSTSLKSKILNSNKRIISNNIKSENKNFTSNLCNVCDKPSIESQYGVEPCEACKNFFKRYSKKTNKNPPCTENCDLNKDKRLSCASCRYQKCLTIGMKPSNKLDMDESSFDLNYKQHSNSIKTNLKYTKGYEIIKKETDDNNNNLQNYNLPSNDLDRLNYNTIKPSSGSGLLTMSENKTSSIKYNNHSISNCNEINRNENFMNSSKNNKLIIKIAKEIEIKKKLIRMADSEQTIKEHLVQLTLNIAYYFLNMNEIEANESVDSATNDWYDNSDKYTKSLLNNMNKNSLFEAMKRPLLVAYSYLIEDEYNNISSNTTFKVNNQELKPNILLFPCKLTPYELNLTNQLHKIYSSYYSFSKTKIQNDYNYPIEYQFCDGLNFNGSTNLQSNSLTSQTNNSIRLGESFTHTDIENVSSTNLSELKMLHFLLLLFSCYLNIDEFYLENYSLNHTKVCAGSSNISKSLLNLNINHNNQNLSIDGFFCQKSILKLIDLICTDSIIKTKILLSVSDLDLI